MSVTVNAAYWLDRLRAERPDLFERVERGMLSVYGATVQAGWRRKTRRTRNEIRLRLKRERPDLFELVERGMLSVTGAQIRAGWRKRRPPGPTSRGPTAAYYLDPGAAFGREASPGPRLERLPIIGWSVEGNPIVDTRQSRSPTVTNALWLTPRDDGAGYHAGSDRNPFSDIIYGHASCGEFDKRWLIDGDQADRLLRAYRIEHDRLLRERQAREQRYQQQQQHQEQRGWDQPRGSGPGFGVDADLAILGLTTIPQNDAELTDAFRKASKAAHPDHHPGEGHRTMARINAARDRIRARMRPSA